jgi:RNA polymerase sigma factor (sigma-70 family)
MCRMLSTPPWTPRPMTRWSHAPARAMTSGRSRSWYGATVSRSFAWWLDPGSWFRAGGRRGDPGSVRPRPWSARVVSRRREVRIVALPHRVQPGALPQSAVRYRSPHLTVDALRERPSLESGPFDRLAEARRDRVVLDCVAVLPEAYQAAVRLHYWMDASIAEIASLLAVPENTVKSYLYRARRLLEAMLKTRGLE